MSIMYMMIGLPAAGKSTWRHNRTNGGFSMPTASSDDYIDSMARIEGKTYNEVFKDHMKAAQTHVDAIVSGCIRDQKSFIWDQTNLSIKTRAPRLARIPFDWEKVAVVVRCADFTTWKERLMSRPGKTIPVHVIETMRKSFEPPTVFEGFTEILEITT